MIDLKTDELTWAFYGVTILSSYSSAWSSEHRTIPYKNLGVKITPNAGVNFILPKVYIAGVILTPLCSVCTE